MTELGQSPYRGYLYAYPHKTAYRPLRPRPALREIWGDQPRDALTLYLHLPFCEMRCGFCNLFTRANPKQDQVDAYLRQLRDQAEVVRAALSDAVPAADAAVGEARFATAAVGGGTPTFLNPKQLVALFDIVTLMTGTGSGAPLAVETSPGTATPDRLAVLAENGTTRVSIGVQSFLDAEVHTTGRAQHSSDVDGALAAIRAVRIPILNIDLIYGIAGQTPGTWSQSLRAALDWRPEEIFLYPLYVRPLTGLGRRSSSTVDDFDPSWDADRMTLYRLGRDTLRSAGYEQVCMRQFRRSDVVRPPIEHSYQDNGMVGLGCGSRSYTSTLHYSFDYAVSVTGVRKVLADYLSTPAADFAHAEVGYRLDPAEQRRRWLLMSLLTADGVDVADYRWRFATSVVDDFPQLEQLSSRGWLMDGGNRLALTDEGLAHSDAIGPWLVSAPVRAAMAQYALR